MAKFYRVIQMKLNQFKKMSISSLTYQQSVFKRYHSDKHFSEFLSYKMAAKFNWHRYGTKLRHCRPMYCDCTASSAPTTKKNIQTRLDSTVGLILILHRRRQ